MRQGGTSFSMFTTHWGTFRAEVRDGVVQAIHDLKSDPDPSRIGKGMLSALYHPTRIKVPSIRKGFLKDGYRSDRNNRRSEAFVEVPWDEALEITANELARVCKTYGNSAIYGGSYGWASAGRFHHAQSQVHRFLNCIGGYTASIDTYSYAAVSALTPHIVGPFAKFILDQATAWPVMERHTELFVMFGGMAHKNAQINAGGVGHHNLRKSLVTAHRNGAEFISISPIGSDALPEINARWISPRPGSDTALMLALAHVLYSEQLCDLSFLARYCVGFEDFLPYLLGQTDGIAKTPEWAAEICALPAESIIDLARKMAAKRTMISVAWSLQRAEHGEQPCWMAIVLAAMLGQIGLPGGGFGLGYGCANGVGNASDRLRFPALPQGENPVRQAIPVARISDALLNPGSDYDFNGATHTYPDLRLIYWAGGNPFHHHQDINRLIKAFRQPETIIVNEPWWTATARHADIVFPVTTALEREDIAMVRWDPMITAMRKAIEPLGQARSDYDVFSGLARVMGVENAFTQGRSAEEWLRHIWQGARDLCAKTTSPLPDLETLRRAETLTRPIPDELPVLLQEFCADPVANPLTTRSGKIEIFSKTIASFGYADCPGHPIWIAPDEWLGSDLAKTYPLHLISNQPKTRLHSQLDCGDESLGSKINGREPAQMHPDDAAARGLVAGNVVRLFNTRGACLAGVEISDQSMRGVVRLSTGAWYDPEMPGKIGSLCKHGNPNVLTRDQGTSALGQGPSAHSTLVQVERFEGALPPITAHAPPPIEQKETNREDRP